MRYKKPKLVLHGHLKPPTSLARLGSYVVSGDEDGCLVVWRDLKKVFQVQFDQLIQSLLADGQDVLVQLRGGAIKRGRISEDGFIQDAKFSIASGEVGFFKAILYRSFLILPGTEGAHQVDLWETHSQKLVRRSLLDAGSSSVMCHVGLVVRETVLVVGLDNGAIGAYDLTSMTQLSTLQVLDEPVFSLAAFDDKIIVAGATRNVVALHFDGVAFFGRSGIEIISEGVADLACNGSFLFLGCWDGKVRVYDTSLAHCATLEYHLSNIKCMSLSDNSEMLVGSKDNAISLWSY